MHYLNNSAAHKWCHTADIHPLFFFQEGMVTNPAICSVFRVVRNFLSLPAVTVTKIRGKSWSEIFTSATEEYMSFFLLKWNLSLTKLSERWNKRPSYFLRGIIELFWFCLTLCCFSTEVLTRHWKQLISELTFFSFVIAYFHQTKSGVSFFLFIFVTFESWLMRMPNLSSKFLLKVRFSVSSHVFFFLIERPPLLKLDNVRARAKAWGKVLRDVILSSKPKRTLKGTDRFKSGK